MDLNPKLSSRRSDGLHYLEEDFKINRSVYFYLQNNFIFMHLEEEKEKKLEISTAQSRVFFFLDALSE